MRLFLSWSGERSRAFADAFRGWLPNVIQAAKPWMSSANIDAGKTWNAELRSQLDQLAFGIAFVTRESLKSPWLNFEAGALAKSTSEGQLCPLLFDGLDVVALGGLPLAQFQAKAASEAGIRDVVMALSAAMGTEALPADLLESAFSKWWPELAEKFAEVPSAASPPLETRPDTEVLQEVLSVVRRIDDREARESADKARFEFNQKAIEYVEKRVDSQATRTAVAMGIREALKMSPEDAASLADRLEAKGKELSGAGPGLTKPETAKNSGMPK